MVGAARYLADDEGPPSCRQCARSDALPGFEAQRDPTDLPGPDGAVSSLDDDRSGGQRLDRSALERYGSRPRLGSDGDLTVQRPPGQQPEAHEPGAQAKVAPDARVQPGPGRGTMTTRAQAPGRGDARPQPGSDPVRNPARSGTKPCGGCDSMADRPGGCHRGAAGSPARPPPPGSPRCPAPAHPASRPRASAAA